MLQLHKRANNISRIQSDATGKLLEWFAIQVFIYQWGNALVKNIVFSKDFDGRARTGACS